MDLRRRIQVSLRAQRWIATVRCLLPLRDTTVVIVNWQSLDLLRDTVAALAKFASEVKVLVVDNGSTDGSAEWLRRQPFRSILLGRNTGHGAALDLGFLSARTRNVVALDVDAFPISCEWLPCLLGPLEDGERVVGAHGGDIVDEHSTEPIPDEWKGRSFAHPCCMAMRWRRFVLRRHSFRRTQGAGRKLDPGELISAKEAPRVRLLDPTSMRGPGMLGTVFGGVVYHNYFGTRHRSPNELIHGISRADTEQAWREAVEQHVTSAARDGEDSAASAASDSGLSARRRKAWTGARVDVVNLVPPASRLVLDVGCSNGSLGAVIKDRLGASVWGIELDPMLAAEAEARLDRVFAGDALVHLRSGAIAEVDCVVLADVLEHVADPWAMFDAAAQCVRPGGHLVASIPNVAHWSTHWALLRGRWPQRERGIHDSTHLRFFAKKNIVELMNRPPVTLCEIRRKYRLVEFPHRLNRLSAIGRVWPNLFTFQYLCLGQRLSS